MEATIKEFITELDEDDLRLAPPNLLINVQGRGQKPVAKQGWHTDMAEDQWGMVAIAPVQKSTLLAFPGSAAEIREFQRLEKLVEKDEITKAELVAWLRGRHFRAVRIVLHPGELLFMTGDTVHAGDRGIHGERSLRMHWYITQGTAKDNSTQHLGHFGDDFSQCFH